MVPNTAKIVAVQLKRKLEMKNPHLQEYIRPAKCIKAVEALKACGNLFYQNVDVDRNFMETDEVCTLNVYQLTIFVPSSTNVLEKILGFF